MLSRHPSDAGWFISGTGKSVTEGLDLQTRNSAEGLASSLERRFIRQKRHSCMTKHLLAQGQKLAGGL